MDVKMIKSEYDREREDIESNHYMETRELREMIKTIEEIENESLKNMQDAHDGLREETKNKNVEELESMKHELIKQIEKLDKEFEVHFNKYVADTETKAANSINATQATINASKLENTYWSLKRAQNKTECTWRNEQLRKEFKRLQDHYHGLKKKMQYLREDKEKHLGNLSLDSLNCMEKLKSY